MIPILCGNHISFCYFFALVVVRGPHFCVNLKMCTNRFHILGQIDFKKCKYSKMGSQKQMMPTTSLDLIALIIYDFGKKVVKNVNFWV